MKKPAQKEKACVTRVIVTFLTSFFQSLLETCPAGLPLTVTASENWFLVDRQTRQAGRQAGRQAD